MSVRAHTRWLQDSTALIQPRKTPGKSGTPERMIGVCARQQESVKPTCVVEAQAAHAQLRGQVLGDCRKVEAVLVRGEPMTQQRTLAWGEGCVLLCTAAVDAGAGAAGSRFTEDASEWEAFRAIKGDRCLCDAS